ncbi:lipoyl(octanoyl) transferase LipB [Methylomonas sp. AM2-LC]|uniref:lipoyl(octanoyl) transferase LipB n=1 Tax=Methylomonas sp. AM2-LC TaxID=3153301 RepID=UPI0032634E0B
MVDDTRTVVRNLGVQDYVTVWQQMQQFTAERTESTADEIWITEHPPVYTLGLNGKLEHLLSATNIPVVASDRGGQISYHGPGQLVVYVLIDLRRCHLGPRQIVTILENAVRQTLRQYGISAETKPTAPGVYVAEKKIASLGLRIKRGCCYHGLSLNNNMDLTPFLNINPCGYAGLEVTQLLVCGVDVQTHEVAVPVIHQIIKAIEL